MYFDQQIRGILYDIIKLEVIFIETKICSKCGTEKRLDEFRLYTKHERKYIQSICKKCENERNKEYAKNHVEEIRKYKKQ